MFIGEYCRLFQPKGGLLFYRDEDESEKRWPLACWALIEARDDLTEGHWHGGTRGTRSSLPVTFIPVVS